MFLAGQERPLSELLRASPALAARFPAVIDFPDHTAGQFTAIFAVLAAEAGFTLTRATAHKADVVLGQTESRRPSGNARLAVRLLDQTASSQARRIMALPAPGPADLSSICPDDLPGRSISTRRSQATNDRASIYIDESIAETGGDPAREPSA